MRKTLTYAVAILVLGAVTTVVFADRQNTNTAPPRGRYLPEYTKDGDLVLPKNWRSWVYVCLLYTSPSPRDRQKSRMPSSA